MKATDQTIAGLTLCDTFIFDRLIQVNLVQARPIRAYQMSGVTLPILPIQSSCMATPTDQHGWYSWSAPRRFLLVLVRLLLKWPGVCSSSVPHPHLHEAMNIERPSRPIFRHGCSIMKVCQALYNSKIPGWRRILSISTFPPRLLVILVDGAWAAFLLTFRK